MRLLFLGLIVLAAGFQGYTISEVPLCALHQDQDPCATGEVPCDPDKPWHRGTVEKACSRDGQPWAGDPDAKEWHACDCHHDCKENPEPDDETQGRVWDPQCEARCRPSHCHCPSKCQTD